MKLFPALLASAALSAGATAGLLQVLRPMPEAAAESVATPKTKSADRSSAAVTPERPEVDLVASIDPMEADRLRQLEERVAELEQMLREERMAVSVPEMQAAADVAALDVDDPEATQLVLDVLAAEEARKDAERAQREQERLLESLNRRAERVSEKVGLNEKQSAQLVEIWLVEDQQRDEARDIARDMGWDVAREQFDAIEAWKEQEIAAQFGADVAASIDEADEGRRGGRGGRGGR